MRQISFLSAPLLAICLSMSHPAPLLAQDQPAPSAPQMLPGAVPATVPNAPPTDLPLAPAHDLSPLGMYNQAHWVVKAVMLSLLAACFATWTIWLFKTVELLVARQRARQSGRILARAATLDEATGRLGSRRDPATVMALAVAEEYGRSAPAIAPAGAEGIKERAQSLVARIEGQTLARARRGTGVLATIGAIAPFVGLFGTVWGIMNSFIGIAESKTTNLAVVAPGIAEALLATAIGLVAAIPAVVIYNQFSRSLAAYRLLLGDAAAAVLRLLSRDIDFRSMKG